MNQPYIVGWGHTPFGKLDNMTLEQLIRDAVYPALDSAGLEPGDIDAIYMGHFNNGFVPQDFSASLAAVAIPEFRHTPAVRLENACATGSAAIHNALDALASVAEGEAARDALWARAETGGSRLVAAEAKMRRTALERVVT